MYCTWNKVKGVYFKLPYFPGLSFRPRSSSPLLLYSAFDSIYNETIFIAVYAGLPRFDVTVWNGTQIFILILLCNSASCIVNLFLFVSLSTSILTWIIYKHQFNLLFRQIISKHTFYILKLFGTENKFSASDVVTHIKQQTMQ